MNLLEADSESWRRFDEALEDATKRVIRYLLPPNPSREKIETMEELIQDLERKEAECREYAANTIGSWQTRLEAKADGIRFAIDYLKALLKRQSEPFDLSELKVEIIATDPQTGFIPPMEIRRIFDKYGVRLKGDYNFAKSGELRLQNGAKLVF